MPPSTPSIFGRRILDRVTAEDYVAWAVGMLVEQYDSPNLRMLAALEREANAFEAEQHFDQAVRELNIPLPDRSCALRAVACEMAQQICDDIVSPAQGLSALFRLCVASEYASEFIVWYELSEALDYLGTGNPPWTYKTATKESIDDMIKMEAKKFIEQARQASAVS